MLVADADMRFTVAELLARSQSFGIRSITHDILTHPQRDAGCRGGADTFLRPFGSQYAYALVMFDREGCG